MVVNVASIAADPVRGGVVWTTMSENSNLEKNTNLSFLYKARVLEQEGSWILSGNNRSSGLFEVMGLSKIDRFKVPSSNRTMYVYSSGKCFIKSTTMVL